MKYNHKCPFCKKDIPKIYIVRTIIKKKRKKNRVHTIKDVIGEDWNAHSEECKELKAFLESTKNEDIIKIE